MKVSRNLTTYVNVFFPFLTGSHIGEHIHDKYEEVITYYGLINKVSYIVTDNAASMRAAFRVAFPDVRVPAEETNSDADESSDADLFHVNQDKSVEAIEGERISCFAHSLQLTVGDGLKETKVISPAMSKCVAVSNHLHRSTAYKVSLSWF